MLYAAPRRRVQESAQILPETLGLPVHIEPVLSGPDHGEADGRPWDEIKAAFGGPAQSDPDRPYAPGSETWNHYLARAGAALSRLILIQLHEGQRILIAGHGETVDAAATVLLGLSPGSSTRVGFESAYASITRWNMQRNRFGQEVWILAALNDTRASRRTADVVTVCWPGAVKQHGSRSKHHRKSTPPSGSWGPAG